MTLRRIAPHKPPFRSVWHSLLVSLATWVQARVTESPEISGPGDLVLLPQARYNRPADASTLLQDAEKRRYEVELQLGATDEWHIIRTFKYWDIKRKFYPPDDHCAVLTAKDITSRSLNVISLFNEAFPIVALQMQAALIDNNIALIFTTDRRALLERTKVPKPHRLIEPLRKTRQVARQSGSLMVMLSAIKERDPGYELKFYKFNIGLEKNDHPNNFVTFFPAKPLVRQCDDPGKMIENEGFEVCSDKGWRRYRLNFSKGSFRTINPLAVNAANLAYELRY